ncbi:hypothetical protein HYDPIDRAFT_32453 [Hydnomerulius pinastri MD-312]|uniref:Unplaced genomic scaffold scaffold_41, whole genome shotgun sequence n=1 Tax=Hydnomerulius pinastri MD-312 TaxID=994086 RepID=A0A0C9WAL2_9AGAM|nr:hypothetical protein HYDPIDRAFT_32453 [Hydnomerulius pinastri MD-312]
MSPTKSAFFLFPQLLLSSSLPTSTSTQSATPSPSTTSSSTSNSTSTANPRSPSHILLSTRDPLSLPIMTSECRRFVAKIRSVFWLQDRVDEVIVWKQGWKRTTAWLAVYGFICVMLAYYPDPGKPSVRMNVSEGTIDWQANIQAIQNLIGALSQPPVPPPPSLTHSHFKSASTSTSTIPPSSPSPSSDPSAAAATPPTPDPTPPLLMLPPSASHSS